MIGFGKYEKRLLPQQPQEITSLADNRLVKIDPQAEGFFDAALNFKTTQKSINCFIEAIEEVKTAKLEAFYKPICDPSIGCRGESPIIYQFGKKPAVGYSYKWWVETVDKMPTVEGKKWEIATEYQWYAFLVEIINRKIKLGESLANVLEEVVNNSTNLGNYYDSENLVSYLKPTGSRCICGFYDLANARKILKCSNQKVDGYWIASGCYKDLGRNRPLAELSLFIHEVQDRDFYVAMLVL